MAQLRNHGIFLAVLALGLASASGAGQDARTAPRWQYAGENKGIRFHFRIANECLASGAHLDLKLENTLDHAVTVSFRVVDPDWKQTFERELEANGKDVAIRFTPDEGTACHPYVDEVYVESRSTQVTHSGDGRDEASP
jgi:hypothetical protein